MSRVAVQTLRVLLVVLFAGAVLAQLWFFPVLAGEIAQEEPTLAWLRWPMLAVVVLAIAGGQVALVAIWVLLGMTEAGSVFSPRAFRWVDVIIVAVAADTLLALAVNIFLSCGIHANPPALFLGLGALTVCGTAFALLMGVMKGLLRSASTMTAELGEVI